MADQRKPGLAGKAKATASPNPPDAIRAIGSEQSSKDGAGAPIGRIKPAKQKAQAPGAQAMPVAPQGGSGGNVDKQWSARMPLMIGMISILVMLGGFGIWAVFTEISGAVVTSGRIEVDRSRQILQHPDGGVVAEILVDEGDVVKAGQPLIRLDPLQLNSRRAIIESQLFELMARRSRLEAERDEHDKVQFDPDLIAAAEKNPDIRDLMLGQERLFVARAKSIKGESAQLGKRRNQIKSQIKGIDAQIVSTQAQLKLISKELEDQQALLRKGLAQASRVLSLQREEARMSGAIGELTARRAQAEERVTEIDLEIIKLTTRRREEAIVQLRDLRPRELELAEQRRTVLEQLDRLDLRAPVSGIVYGLRVFTPRSVLRAADPVLFLVPKDRPLVIAAQIDPLHIDQVFVGQEVTVRFSAFDQRESPDLKGRVSVVSADVFQDDATGVTYYKAEITLSKGEVAKLPKGAEIIPGMPVEAFIKTYDRSPLSYLVKPFTDYFFKAFREG